MGSELFELTRTVAPADIDQLGHVGNLEYLGWLLEAAEAHSAAVGLTWARYQELGGVFVVRRHEFDYLAAALEGDRLRVRTWISSTARASSTRKYEIHRDATCVLRGVTTWAFIRLDTGRPCRIPEPVLSAFGIETPSHTPT
ncbi:4-hydroxybenzoyl-CoA thioesterase domain protein [Enhygromyxa salina]|uniref:4-hydroxybenzoyl-CoA thioesterase domain protein n=1 Tax=Enhygromyxa salina TaxID=215803 RepID=A0A0C2A1Z2_9BACT|nr:thioesterase family protein [Enhygromyxa salina]KIG17398.1 4-hydroxybenzoyl-CoA thioesterase domain protein [Enhygromyxa salina]